MTSIWSHERRGWYTWWLITDHSGDWNAVAWCHQTPLWICFVLFEFEHFLTHLFLSPHSDQRYSSLESRFRPSFLSNCHSWDTERLSDPEPRAGQHRFYRHSNSYTHGKGSICAPHFVCHHRVPELHNHNHNVFLYIHLAASLNCSHILL